MDKKVQEKIKLAWKKAQQVTEKVAGKMLKNDLEVLCFCAIQKKAIEEIEKKIAMNPPMASVYLRILNATSIGDKKK